MVIEKTLKASAAAGLDPASTKSFFLQQIAVAKKIQRARIASWKSRGKGPKVSPRSLKEIRPLIIELGDAIVNSLVLAAKEGKGSQKTFVTIVEDKDLSLQDKVLLYQALTAIRLNTP